MSVDEHNKAPRATYLDIYVGWVRLEAHTIITVVYNRIFDCDMVAAVDIPTIRVRDWNRCIVWVRINEYIIISNIWWLWKEFIALVWLGQSILSTLAHLIYKIVPERCLDDLDGLDENIFGICYCEWNWPWKTSRRSSSDLIWKKNRSINT